MSAQEAAPDPFDRLYSRWAGHATGERLDPPSRQRWDSIVLRLILSEDPDRVRRYRHIEAEGPDSLGADAYELWRKMPSYTPNLTAPSGNRLDFKAYEQAQQGSMKRLMEAQGLGDRYNAIVEAQQARKANARRAQASVIIIGCIGMSAIAFMLLTVLLIIAVKLSG